MGATARPLHAHSESPALEHAVALQHLSDDAEPNNFVAKIHDRMPVLLQPDQFTPWLGGTAGKEILKPQSEDYLKMHPLSKRVNSSRTSDEDATLIEALKAEA